LLISLIKLESKYFPHIIFFIAMKAAALSNNRRASTLDNSAFHDAILLMDYPSFPGTD
jgi:hypothetical protein